MGKDMHPCFEINALIVKQPSSKKKKIKCEISNYESKSTSNIFCLDRNNANKSAMYKRLATLFKNSVLVISCMTTLDNSIAISPTNDEHN